MIELIDIKTGLLNAAFKKRRHFIYFSLSTLIAVLLILVLMLTSNDKYVLELIFTVFIGSTYLCYLVFYFTVIRRIVVNELRFYEGASKSNLTPVRCELIQVLDGKKMNNGLEYYVLEANVDENLKEEKRNFFLKEKFSFKKDQKAILYVFGTVIVKLELIK